MFQLRNRLQNLVGQELGLLNDQNHRFLMPMLNSVQSKLTVKNKAIDDKERLSKPRSQIKGIELLRNPSLFKVKIRR